MTNKKSDDNLLQSLITGDEAGIREIYSKVYPKVLGYVCKHDGSEDDAKDVMQKGLLQLATRAQAKDFSITSSFEAYLFTRRLMNRRSGNCFRRNCSKYQKIADRFYNYFLIKCLIIK